MFSCSPPLQPPFLPWEPKFNYWDWKSLWDGHVCFCQKCVFIAMVQRALPRIMRGLWKQLPLESCKDILSQFLQGDGCVLANTSVRQLCFWTSRGAVSVSEQRPWESVYIRAGHAQIVPVWMLLGRGGTGAHSLVYSVGLKYAEAIREIQEENKAV